MASLETDAAVTGNELRERVPPQHLMTHRRDSSQDARTKVLELNAAEDIKGDHHTDKRTYGRTPDGRGES
jgi:phosphatidylethanolamine N-methyltransferase